LVESAASLPDECLEQVLPVLKGWPEFGVWAPELLERLWQRGAWALALDVLGALLVPKTNARSGSIGFPVSEFDFGRFRPAVRFCIDEQPEDTYRLLMERLLAAVTLMEEAGRRLFYYWRPAIEDHVQNHPNLEPMSQFLLSATRDALLAWIRSEPTETSEEVSA